MKSTTLSSISDNVQETLSEGEIRRLAMKLTTTLESITDAFYMLDQNWCFAYLNGEAERALKRTRDDLLGKNIWKEYPAAVGTTFYVEFHRAIDENRSIVFEDYYTPFNKWFEVHLYPSEVGLAVYFRDITARKYSEIELIRTNQTLQMLSLCNETLLKAETEHDLLNKICSLAVEVGGYRRAYVVFIEDSATQTFFPVAHAGTDGEDCFSDTISIGSGWTPTENSPERQCVVMGNPVIVNDIARSESSSVTLAIGRQFDCGDLICLPIRDKTRVFGVFILYSAATCHISSNETKLLQKLANDLAFGIINLRAQEERRNFQAAVMKVATAVSASSGLEFFEQLARNMAEALGAQAGFVARLLPGEPLTARTVTAVVDGQPVDNFEYLVAGTPCENLVTSVNCIVPDSVALRFPRSLSLAAVGAQAYVGRRLDNSDKQPIGFLFVLFRQKLKSSEFITSTLKIFAARAAAELERQDIDRRVRQQASLLDQATDAIVVRDINNLIQFWNKGAERLYGWTSDEAVGRSIEDLLHDDPTAIREATRCVLERGAWNGEIIERRKDGRSLVIEGNWTLVRDEFSRPHAIFAIKTDITERKMVEQEIQELAFYDPLTHLPNRRLLLNRLHQALGATARSQRYGALLFLDLDNFKTINDTLGHDQGDLLLKQVALRLTSWMRASDTVARFGGDEFVIMLIDLSESAADAAAQVKVIGEKILSGFTNPFILNEREHFTSPSIGATLFMHQQYTVEELLKRADLAMYEAKTAGRNTIRFFDPEMQKEVTDRVALEKEFRQAVQRKEFVLHYQPQVDRLGNVVGAEVLVRWQHPIRGLLNPAEFIPLAEEIGLIQQLGHWVLENACAQLATWATNPGMERLSMAVNVCADEFRHPNFIARVLEIIDHSGINPQLLKLELTESVIVENVEETITKMELLKMKGISFSLDDFGTGYSSLSYLKRMPLSQLKIDQSFIRDILTDSNDAAIARTIVALAESLGLSVIAEGVETEEQKSFLANNGCHVYQGYLFSRPLPAEKFNDFINRQIGMVSKK